MSADHMQTLRDLAVERAQNAETAKYAVIAVQYGVNTLESHFYGSFVKKPGAQTGTKRSLEVRGKWAQAIKLVMTLPSRRCLYSMHRPNQPDISHSGNGVLASLTSEHCCVRCTSLHARHSRHRSTIPHDSSRIPCDMLHGQSRALLLDRQFGADVPESGRCAYARAATPWLLLCSTLSSNNKHPCIALG
jgi:hypothetical protein